MAESASVKRLVSHLQKNGKDCSWYDLTKRFNPGTTNAWWARDTARLNGFNTKTGIFEVEKKIEDTRHKKNYDRHAKTEHELTSKILILQKQLEVLSNIDNYDPQKFIIPVPSTSRKHEGTAIVQWSDWHVDEVVDPETVNFQNQYNKKIARARAETLSQNTVKITETQRSAIDIPYLILHLGGDFIGGYIHEELEQTNSMSPIQAVFYSCDLLCSGIDYLLKNGKFKGIKIVCTRGNHGRTTKKMQYSNDHAMSYETFLYYSLMKEYQKEKRVNFKIDKGELSYMQVYDKSLRFFHGHQIKFKGGIGGVTIPLYKAIHRWNNNKAAYYNFMCDKHTYSLPTPDCQLNGSLKGFDALAESHGVSYQPPLQSFCLLDAKRGITIKAPIFCE